MRGGRGCVASHKLGDEEAVVQINCKCSLSGDGTHGVMLSSVLLYFCFYLVWLILCCLQSYKCLLGHRYFHLGLAYTLAKQAQQATAVSYAVLPAISVSM